MEEKQASKNEQMQIWQGLEMEKIQLLKDVPIPMRDGLDLAANIYRPASEGKYPVIMAFTGFGKDQLWSGNFEGYGYGYEPWSPTITGSTTFEANDPQFWCHCGYILIIVDPRGFNRSPGTAAHAEFDGPPGEFALLNQGRWARDQYDAIEWVAAQDWCNGNVALSGVSILGFSQWRVAAMAPPHLKCFNPWEGMTDFYRDCLIPGGILETLFCDPSGEFGHQLGLFDTAWPAPEHEDPPAPDERPEDDYLGDIKIPALICGNWTDHGCHTRGSFRAFNKISSKEKWLYIHGRQKWAEFYTSEARTMRKLFFDHYLKGTDDRILSIPRVRFAVMEDINKYTVRFENNYPAANTDVHTLYLNASNNTLSEKKPEMEEKSVYSAEENSKGKAYFDYKFNADTEFTGNSALKVFISQDSSTDADIFVTLRKIGRDGKEVTLDSWIAPGNVPLAIGWLEASKRKLDAKKSSLLEPYPETVVGDGEKLKPNEIVECNIPILPTGILFRSGETLRLEVSGEYRSGDHVPGCAYEYKSRFNKGNHTVYTGGKYESALYISLAKV